MSFAQVPVVPPPIFSYPGDPGTLGNPPVWRTSEFLRDWGMRAVGAEFAYAAGFSGQNTNVGVVDSGYFLGWTTEHAGPAGVDRWISVTVTGGTTGPTPGFYNQTYNDTHGTHVSGTVAAARDLPVTPTPPAPASGPDAWRFLRRQRRVRQHAQDRRGVLRAAARGSADRLLLDNEYLGNVYRTVAVTPNPTGVLPRVIHSSWGSQPSTENYNTYDPPAGSPASFGVNPAWRYLDHARRRGRRQWPHRPLAPRSPSKSREPAPPSSASAPATAATTTRRAAATRRTSCPISKGTGRSSSRHHHDGADLQRRRLDPGAGHASCTTGAALPNGGARARRAQSINSTVVTMVNGVPERELRQRIGHVDGRPARGVGAEPGHAAVPVHEQRSGALHDVHHRHPERPDRRCQPRRAIDNPNKGQIIQVPETRNGWGEVSLRNAYRGPGQLFGHITLDTQGFSDVWSNNISDVAIAGAPAGRRGGSRHLAGNQGRQGLDQRRAAGWRTSSRVSDYQIGTAREAARNARIYTGQLDKQGAGTLFLTGTNTFHGASDGRRRQALGRRAAT